MRQQLAHSLTEQLLRRLKLARRGTRRAPEGAPESAVLHKPLQQFCLHRRLFLVVLVAGSKCKLNWRRNRVLQTQERQKTQLFITWFYCTFGNIQDICCVTSMAISISSPCTSTVFYRRHLETFQCSFFPVYLSFFYYQCRINARDLGEKISTSLVAPGNSYPSKWCIIGHRAHLFQRNLKAAANDNSDIETSGHGHLQSPG